MGARQVRLYWRTGASAASARGKTGAKAAVNVAATPSPQAGIMRAFRMGDLDMEDRQDEERDTRIVRGNNLPFTAAEARSSRWLAGTDLAVGKALRYTICTAIPS